MTGFASAEGVFEDASSFQFTVKSVNHRFLDLQLRLPGGCEALEAELRREVKQRVERGHVELTLEFGRGARGSLRVDEEALDALVASVRAAAGRLGLTREPELGALLRVPGVLLTEARPARRGDGEVKAAVMALLPGLLERFDAVRLQEGAALEQELRDGVDRLRAACEGVLALRGGVRERQYERLRMRMQELLAGVPVSEERLVVEAALLAEKSDVEEEMVRLRTHGERFLAILDAGGPVGKRLDFLLQELNREANTLLSKTGSAAGPDSFAITDLGLVMKTEIERAREQVQNLE